MSLEILPDEDGTFEIPLGQEALPVLKQGFKDNLGSFFLVAFSGALSTRGEVEMAPPFFSGVRIAAEMKLPLLSFSDPTMAQDSAIKLAFYAGSRKTPDLPDILARLIDQVARRTGRTPILMGGSGGGFAALNVGYRCRSDGYALIWNPQTRISQYVATFVAQYIDIAFPGSRDETREISEQAKYILQTEGAGDSVMDIRKPMRTIYFQNITDWHVDAHLKPFLETLNWRFIEGRSALLCDDMDLAVCIGNSGQGHAPIAREIIQNAIHLITEFKSPAEIAHHMLNNLGADIGDLDAPLSTEDITLTTQKDNGYIHISLTVSKLCPGAKYAFYLIKDGIPIFKIWYGEIPSARFVDPGEGVLKITGFVRKFSGEVIATTVPVSR